MGENKISSNELQSNNYEASISKLCKRDEVEVSPEANSLLNSYGFDEAATLELKSVMRKLGYALPSEILKTIGNLEITTDDEDVDACIVTISNIFDKNVPYGQCGDLSFKLKNRLEQLNLPTKFKDVGEVNVHSGFTKNHFNPSLSNPQNHVWVQLDSKTGEYDSVILDPSLRHISTLSESGYTPGEESLDVFDFDMVLSFHARDIIVNGENPDLEFEEFLEGTTFTLGLAPACNSILNIGVAKLSAGELDLNPNSPTWGELQGETYMTPYIVLFDEGSPQTVIYPDSNKSGMVILGKDVPLEGVDELKPLLQALSKKI